jgi:hypothetical protein
MSWCDSSLDGWGTMLQAGFHSWLGHWISQLPQSFLPTALWPWGLWLPHKASNLSAICELSTKMREPRRLTTYGGLQSLLQGQLYFSYLNTKPIPAWITWGNDGQCCSVLVWTMWGMADHQESSKIWGLQPPAHAGSLLADFSTLKMEPTRSSEMSVHTRSTQCHTPEDGILHQESSLSQWFFFTMFFDSSHIVFYVQGWAIWSLKVSLYSGQIPIASLTERPLQPVVLATTVMNVLEAYLVLSCTTTDSGWYNDIYALAARVLYILTVCSQSVQHIHCHIRTAYARDPKANVVY